MDGTRSTRTSASVRRSRLLVALLLLGVLLILTLLAGPAALAGPKRVITDPTAEPSWVRMIAGPGAGSDAASDVLLLSGGVSLVAGTLSNAAGSTDISLTRYVDGEPSWAKSWNGAADGADLARKMALSPDGKYVYIAGASTTGAGRSVIVVVKRSAKSGALKWAKTDNAPGGGNELPTAIGVDAQGNVIVCGYFEGETGLDWVVVSWSASGSRRWDWRYDGGFGDDHPTDLVVSANGKSYTGGSVAMAGGTPAAATARISASGKRSWLKQYLGPEGLGASIMTLAARPGGGVYAAGATRRATTGLDGLLLLYSGKGRRTIVALDAATGGLTDEAFLDIAVGSTGAIVVAGSSAAGAAPRPHYVVYRPDGSTYTAATLATMGADTLTAAATDAFGGWYVSGTFHVGPADTRVFVHRGSVFPFGASWQSTTTLGAGGGDVAAMTVRDTSCAVAGQWNGGGPSGVNQYLMMFVY